MRNVTVSLHIHRTSESFGMTDSYRPAWMNEGLQDDSFWEDVTLEVDDAEKDPVGYAALIVGKKYPTYYIGWDSHIKGLEHDNQSRGSDSAA